MSPPERKIWDTSSGTYSVRVDDATSTVSYVGESHTGTLPGSAGWRVKRITSSATLTTIEWADGDDNFDNIWDNRVSLNYS